MSGFPSSSSSSSQFGGGGGGGGSNPEQNIHIDHPELRTAYQETEPIGSIDFQGTDEPYRELAELLYRQGVKPKGHLGEKETAKVGGSGSGYGKGIGGNDDDQEEDEEEEEEEDYLENFKVTSRQQSLKFGQRESTRVMMDEMILGSRVLTTVEQIKFGRIARRNPTEVVLRLCLQPGLFTDITGLDLAIHAHIIKPEEIASQTTPTREEAAARPGVGVGTGSTHGAQTVITAETGVPSTSSGSSSSSSAPPPHFPPGGFGGGERPTVAKQEICKIIDFMPSLAHHGMSTSDTVTSRERGRGRITEEEEESRQRMGEFGMRGDEEEEQEQGERYEGKGKGVAGVGSDGDEELGVTMLDHPRFEIKEAKEKGSVRYRSVEGSEIPDTMPIYLRYQHTQDFRLTVQVTLTFTVSDLEIVPALFNRYHPYYIPGTQTLSSSSSSDPEESATLITSNYPTSFKQTYQTGIDLQRSTMTKLAQMNLNGWERPKDDVDNELKAWEFDVKPNTGLKVPSPEAGAGFWQGEKLVSSKLGIAST